MFHDPLERAKMKAELIARGEPCEESDIDDFMIRSLDRGSFVAGLLTGIGLRDEPLEL